MKNYVADSRRPLVETIREIENDNTNVYDGIADM